VDSIGSIQSAVEGSCDHGNKPSGSTKPGQFLDQLFTKRKAHAAISRVISHTTVKPALVVARTTAEKHESDNGVLIFRLRKPGRDL
jgi:hypothetical protein